MQLPDSEKTFLYGRQISRQPHTHIHTRKKECRQNDHYHATYIIFLFHCTITSDFYYRTGIRDASFIIPYFFFF